MLFNSLEFPLFLALVLSVFAFLKKTRHRQLLLLGASLFFYGYWKWSYLLLLIFSSGLDFLAAIRISNSRSQEKKRLFLWASLSANLGILFFFKYSAFLGNAFVFEPGQVPAWVPVVLPVGISFYTFQAMAYVIDVYRNRIEAETSWMDYLLFITFFPQLVAGPIERAPQLLGQLKNPKLNPDFRQGIYLILSGFIKKILIADRLGVYVDAVYNDPNAASPLQIATATLFFGFQIYGDFSGYSDIARGCASFFGINLMANFRSPYHADNLGDFWRRWHISLSAWFRDYLYHPLGGNKKGHVRSHANLLIVFCISGLWHGANWTFLLWGTWHGMGLIGERVFGKFLSPGPVFSRWLMLIWVFAGWFFFRVNSVEDAGILLNRLNSGFQMKNWNVFHSASEMSLAMISIGFLLFWERIPEEARLDWVERQKNLPGIAWGLLAGAILIWFGHFKGGDFIYFQF